MPKQLTAAVTLLAFVLLSLRAHHAFAQDPAESDPAMAQARAHFDAGRQAFQARDFAGAVREFKAAQTLRPSPVLDYNIGLAYEQMARPKVAAKYFHRYLQQKPDAPNRAEVEAKLANLEQQEPGDQGNEDTGAAPPPVTAPPPGYQAPPAAGDPYAGYQTPGAPGTYTTQPAKKKSYWWIIFPILGGVTLIALIGVYAWYVTRTVSTVYYNTIDPPTGRVDATSPQAPRSEPGVLFRF